MEEPIEEITTNEPNTNESVYNLLEAVQIRQNALSEKIKSLKESTGILKEQLTTEKKKWLQEIQEATELERKMKCGQIRSMLDFEEGETQRKLEIFKEYLFFTNTTMNLENELKKKSYKDWLSEIADECNHELNRVQDSLTVLKPLKDMASKWSFEENEEQINENLEKGQGDASTEQENSDLSVETIIYTE